MQTVMKHLAARVRCWCLLLVSFPAVYVAGGGMLAAAQTPAPQEPAASTAAGSPVIRVNVRQVLVPVVVTDAKGHHVPGLKQSDFVVTEDGVPQEIAAFRVAADTVPAEVNGPGQADSHPSANANKRVQAAGPVSAANAGSGAGAIRRTYLICVDTLHSAFQNFGRVKEAVFKVLRQEQGSTDSQYALIALGRELHVVQDSTQDAAAVAAAVRSKSFQKLIQDSEAASSAIAVQQFTGLMRNYCSACGCESNGAASSGEMGECPSIKSMVKGALLSFGERSYGLNQTFLRQLAEVVKATAAMPTTRTVIFISDGFNRIPGRELYSILQGFQPRDHSFEFSPRDNGPDIENILKLATRYDVKFYTLDSRGLYSPAFSPGNTFSAGSTFSTNTQMDSRSAPSEATATTESIDSNTSSAARENTDAMAELARETGGLFFENSNDLGKGVARALADAREYYVLAYVPKNEALNGAYRKIVVTLKDAEKKYHVNAKAGYWATSE